MERTIKKQVTGYKTQDGAGVNLVRVLGTETVKEYNPILMLDSFDSTNPADYTAGFPMHPHRGIETISYVYNGKMLHRDSLGNEDMIADGEVQWMTAGSGIMHEERLPASPRMLGVQLWLNLPAADKMTRPAYKSVKNTEIPEITFENGKLRLLAGEYKGIQGYKSHYLPLDYYDVHLNPNSALTIETQSNRSVVVFTLVGEAVIAGIPVKEKTAVKLTDGDTVTLESGAEGAQLLFMSSVTLDEPVAWSGPIVMNTRSELQQAYSDLNSGNFLREDMSYGDK